MAAYRFGTCEYCFPVWGSFALEMAHLAGFQGIQITDGGGYLQPHPKNTALWSMSALAWICGARTPSP